MADKLKKPFHEQVAENLIEQLKQGTAPWQKPWEPGEPGSFMPINPTTGKRYKGINAVHLMAQGRTDQRWMTYKQAAAAGGQVRKGEKGTPIQYWKFTEEQTKTDDSGKPVLDGKGEPVKEEIRLERPRVFFATVFNAEQIDGLPAAQRKEQTWDAIERAEQILKASGATIHHGENNRALYRLATDSIHLPDKAQFPTAANYYATALHELGHWTGHASRLDRDLIHPFGSEGYAREELRAEIASMILGDELGIGHDPSQHASYVGSWIKVLKDDPLEIFRAAADAEKIEAYVLTLEQQLQALSAEQQKEVDAAMMLMGVEGVNNDELEKAAKMARLHEEQVRNDPNSSDEDKAEAKEERKRAEAIVMTNDADLQRRMDRTFIDNRLMNEHVSAWARSQLCNEHVMDWLASDGVDSAQRPRVTCDRIYLVVPYSEHKAAKAAGAVWDKGVKGWYAGDGATLEKLSPWLPENIRRHMGPGMSPREEFAEALRGLGCVITDGHPIMDGKKHRIAAVGDKKGEAAGFYVGHLDGHPAGYIKNNRTGVDMKWKSKGYVLDTRQKAQLQAEAAAKLQARAVEQERLHELAARRVGKQLSELVPVEKATPYMQAKGIAPQPGVFTDRDGKITYIPVTDVDGKQWSMQYINEVGTKRFAKDSRKEGCFHAIGGLEAIAKAPVVVISEGYATAASMASALGHATVAAFDAGNLPAVAKALREKFPAKPFLIAGDNDLAIEQRDGINPGRQKADEAAKAVGGKAFFPIFAPGEQAENPRSFTDFNDLATNSALGREGLERQAREVVGEEAAKHQPVVDKKHRQGNDEQEKRGQGRGISRL
jgi:antirestriction protein ArdC/phage/plasmid primase-like uncharacterized protein